MSVVVAGAKGSLGPAVVERLRRDGHDVVAIDKEDVDLLDEPGTTAWARSLEGVTGVVHLVGGWRGGTPLSEAPLEDWALLHDLLIRTVQHTTRAFAPALKAAGEQGRFVIVSSEQAQRPSKTNAAYAAAKAAAETWTLAYADELAETGGSANIVVVKQITDRNAARIADTIALLLSDTGASMNGRRVCLHR
jgi:NAD(P)-dependent dehydrogenase (short-subunit alcohol dehydrogenase family)